MEWGGGVGAEEEGHLVGTFLRELLCIRDLDGKAHVGNAEGNQTALHLFLHLPGGLLSEGCQFGGLLPCFLPGGFLLLPQGFDFLGTVVETVQLFLELIAQGDELFHGFHMVLFLQGIDGVQPVIDGIEPFGVEFCMR